MISVNNTATKPCLLPFTEPWTSQRRRAKNNFVLKQVIQKHWQFTSKSLELICFKMAKYNEPVNFIIVKLLFLLEFQFELNRKILIIARKSNLFLQLRFCSFRDNKIGMYNIIYHACSPALRPLTFISRVELV